MKNPNRKTALVIASLIPFATLVAAPYSWELGLDYVTGDTDLNDVNFNEDNISFDATYFFQPVDTTMGSLHEAPFLQRSSYLTAGIEVQELDDDISNLIDTETFSISGNFVNPESGWFLELGYIKADPDYDTFFADGATASFRPEFSGYSAKVGKYVAENTTVYLGYTQLDFGGDSSMPALDNADTDNIGIGVKHFGSITEAVAYSLEANYYFIDLQVADFDDLDDDPFDDSGDVFSFAATVYPIRELGIGLSYADSDDLRGAPYLTSTSAIRDGLGLFADWFVTDNISLQVLYNNNNYDLADPDELGDPGEVDNDSLLFGVRTRF